VRTIVNDAIRTGLEHRARRPSEPFRVAAADLGLRDGIELDDIAGLLERIEGSTRR
jgi:hypothetical protein